MSKLSDLLTNPLPWSDFVPVAASSSQSFSSPTGAAQVGAALNGGQPIWNNNLTVAPVQNVNATQLGGGGGGVPVSNQGVSAISPAMQYAEAMNNARLAQEAGPSLGHTGYSGIPATLGNNGGYLGDNQGIASANYQNANAAYAQNPNAATASQVAAAQAQNQYWQGQNPASVSQNQSYIYSTMAQPQTYSAPSYGGGGGGGGGGEQVQVVPVVSEPTGYAGSSGGTGYNSPGGAVSNYGTYNGSYNQAEANIYGNGNYSGYTPQIDPQYQASNTYYAPPPNPYASNPEFYSQGQAQGPGQLQGGYQIDSYGGYDS